MWNEIEPGKFFLPGTICPRTLAGRPAAPWVPGAPAYTLGIRCLRHSRQGKSGC